MNENTEVAEYIFRIVYNQNTYHRINVYAADEFNARLKALKQIKLEFPDVSIDYCKLLLLDVK